jgi:hypothetical protein
MVSSLGVVRNIFQKVVLMGAMVEMVGILYSLLPHTKRLSGNSVIRKSSKQRMEKNEEPKSVMGQQLMILSSNYQLALSLLMMKMVL